MTSKEALKNIETLSYCKQHITIQEWCEIIKQDLDRLEEENEALKMGIESLHTDYKELKETSEFVIEKFKISNKNLTDENEKLEKELKQTKSNFKNSKTHSKNCYKKLKKDMNRLIKIIKDYSFITDYDVAWGVNCEDEEFLRKILK